METYIPLLLILTSVIAFAAYVVRMVWFENHAWPGSSREEIDAILKHNRDELLKKERDREYRNSKLGKPAAGNKWGSN